MKVICVDNKPGEYNCAHRLLKVGEIYNSHQSPVYVDSYILEEVAFDPTDMRFVSFKKRRFVPLSDIDEKEFERNYNKQLA